jgi:hypothetical protein
MPVHSNDLMAEARALYQRMVDECITELPVAGGPPTQQLNFTTLLELVRQQPKAAQLATQLLAQVDDDSGKATAELHGTWLMMALLENFGPDSDVVRVTRKRASGLYESAMRQFEDHGR